MPKFNKAVKQKSRRNEKDFAYFKRISTSDTILSLADNSRIGYKFEAMPIGDGEDRDKVMNIPNPFLSTSRVIAIPRQHKFMLQMVLDHPLVQSGNKSESAPPLQRVAFKEIDALAEKKARDKELAERRLVDEYLAGIRENLELKFSITFLFGIKAESAEEAAAAAYDKMRSLADTNKKEFLKYFELVPELEDGGGIRLKPDFQDAADFELVKAYNNSPLIYKNGFFHLGSQQLGVTKSESIGKINADSTLRETFNQLVAEANKD